MEAIKNWAFSLCIAAITAAIVQMLIPKGNMEKVIRITVRMFVLSVVLAPLFMNFDFKADIGSAFEIKTENYAKQFSSDADEILKKELSVRIGTMIEAELEKIEVYPKSVDVNIVSVEDNLKIEDVRVKLNSKYKIKETDIRYRTAMIADCAVSIDYSEDA